METRSKKKIDLNNKDETCTTLKQDLSKQLSPTKQIHEKRHKTRQEENPLKRKRNIEKKVDSLEKTAGKYLLNHNMVMSSQPGKNCEPHVRNRKELVKRPTVVISILRDSLFDSVSSGLSHRWDIDKNSASQTKLSAEKSDVNTPSTSSQTNKIARKTVRKEKETKSSREQLSSRAKCKTSLHVAKQTDDTKKMKQAADRKTKLEKQTDETQAPTKKKQTYMDTSSLTAGKKDVNAPSTSSQTNKIVQKTVGTETKTKRSREQLSSQAKHSSMLHSAEQTDDTKKMKRVANRKESKLKLEERIRIQAPTNDFITGEIILGTIPGYAPWPARIKNIINETVFIEFFGSGEINPVRFNAIQRFDLNKVKPLLKRRGYKKAMEEVELVLNIPDNISTFQNVK